MEPDPMRRLIDALNGLEAARKRFEAVALDVDESYIPLTETCWWIICVHEGLRTHGEQDYEAGWKDAEGGRIVRGLVHVRNLLGHHRATTVQRITYALTYPITYPLAYGGMELAWLPADDLPDVGRRNPENEAAYESDVAGRNVVQTLAEASAWLHHSVGILGMRLEEAAAVTQAGESEAQ